MALNFDWVSIPEGDWLYRGQTENIAAYRMSRNLVTVAQWNEFLTDPSGYADDRWWGGIPDDSPIRTQLAPAFAGSAMPVTNVSWHEAQAFCKWASFTLGIQISLPSERQFERAAAGVAASKFPWGQTFSGTRANVAGTSASPVGSFPTGASPEGVLDLAGNLYEWCSDEVRRQL
jgi:formylglycine-generating enzyme required for sulfatase activity